MASAISLFSCSGCVAFAVLNLTLVEVGMSPLNSGLLTSMLGSIGTASLENEPGRTYNLVLRQLWQCTKASIRRSSWIAGGFRSDCGASVSRALDTTGDAAGEALLAV